jgi:hypothetical protein
VGIDLKNELGKQAGRVSPARGHNNWCLPAATALAQDGERRLIGILSLIEHPVFAV